MWPQSTNNSITYAFESSKKMQIVSSKSELSTYNTAGEGDCAFHAAKGVWDGNSFRAKDINNLRKSVANKIRECQFGSRIFQSIKQAIQQMLNGREGGNEIQKISTIYKNHLNANNKEINLAWQAFEAELNKHSTVLGYIETCLTHQIKAEEKQILTTQQRKFNRCLNINDGELYGRILSIEELNNKFIAYNQTTLKDFDLDQYLKDGKVIAEYAQIIENPGYWLLPVELEIMAYVLNVTINFHTKDQQTNRKIETYNPGCSESVDVCFNGVNHYERMMTERDFERCLKKPSQEQANNNDENFTSLIANAFKANEHFAAALQSLRDAAIRDELKNLPTRVNTSLNKVQELISHKEQLKNTLHAEMVQIQKFIEAKMGFIESKSTNYLEKIQSIELLGSITNQYLALNKALQPIAIEKTDTAERWHSDRLRLEQQILCQEANVSQSLKGLLSALKDIAEVYFLIPNQCFISYAKPSDAAAHEHWIQPFLINLRQHLHMAGVNAVLDIKDSPASVNMYQYMDKIKTADCVIIVGTESLFQQHISGTSAVCNELILISRRRAENNGKTLPILLSGDFDTALPPYFLMYTNIANWRSKSYINNLKTILASIYSIGPDNSDYNELWNKFDNQYPWLMRGLSEDVVSEQVEQEKKLKQQQKEFDIKTAKEFFTRLNESQKVKYRFDIQLKELEKSLYFNQHRYIIEELELYVPPLSCDPEMNPYATTLAEDKSLLLDVIQTFFKGKEKILLLKGGPGAGKSLFGCYLEKYFWNDFKQLQDPIVIFICLSQLKNPINNLMNEYFAKRFEVDSDTFINRLKTKKNVYFILDGWDEIPQFQEDLNNLKNLYESNALYLWPEAKFIITARTSFLNRITDISDEHSYKKYFAPLENKQRYDLLKIAQIALFDQTQIDKYIDEYVKLRSSDSVSPVKWNSKIYKNQIINLPNVLELIKNPLLLKMTVQALPIIVDWHNARQKNNQNNFFAITRRDVFLAYLKDNLLRQEIKLQKQKGDNQKVPPNIKTLFLNFLINLADMMTKNKLLKVNYQFNAGEVDDGPKWAQQFFGDPYLGKDAKKLQALEIIRSNLTCFLTYEEEKWGFIHDSFIEMLDSINVVELTNLKSKLNFSLGDPNASKNSIAEFSRILFSEVEGPYYLTGKHWSSFTAVSSKSDELKDPSSTDLLFSMKSAEIADKLRLDSAKPEVPADDNYIALVKKAIELKVHIEQNSNGNTALHLAFLEKQIDKIVILLKNIIKEDKEAIKALHIKNNAEKTVLEIFNEVQNILPNINEVRELITAIIKDRRLDLQREDNKNMLLTPYVESILS